MSEPTPANQAAELANILGEGGRSILVTSPAGQTHVFVGPIRAKQFSGILSCLSDLGSVDFNNYFALLTTNGDVAIRLIAEALAPEADPTRRPQQVAEYIVTVGSLDLLEIAKIAGLWYEVNKDFFVQHQTAFLEAFGIPAEQAESIYETVTDLWASAKKIGKAQLAEKGISAGPTSSNSSSPGDTASTTSANIP